jgi:hypothetical protein
LSLLHLAYVIARKRLTSNWQLELVLLLGILLAVALLASSVVFSDLLAEAALRRTLQEATPEQANIWVRVFNDLDDPDVQGRATRYETSVKFVNERVAPRLEGVAASSIRLFETATFYFAGHPQLELDDHPTPDQSRPRGKIQHTTALGDPQRTELVDGVWPGEGLSPEGTLEVVVDETGASLLQLGVGDTLEALPATGRKISDSIGVEIVGVFRRISPESDYWFGLENDFSYQNERWTIVPLFADENALLEHVGRTFPGIHTNTTWIFHLDRTGISAKQVDRIHRELRIIRADTAANLRNGGATIKLDRLLDQYSEQLLLARIPLFLMVFLVTGILAYYLALVASLTIRSRGAEIAMLRSRGSTTGQIGLLVLVEGVLLAIPAVVVGTLVSPVVAKALGGLFFNVDADLGFGLSGGAFLLGLGGAALAVTVLTLSTLVAARRGIVEFRQGGARPGTVPFFHRYYLDVLLLLLIGVMWWQTQSRGSFLVRPTGAQDLSIDYSLLLGPALGLLALGLVVLRLFPIAVALLARVMEPVGPAWLVQGLRRVSRDPVTPGSLVILLMLATALGVIGSAFSATLDRSQQDRALYQAGADLWLQHNGSPGPQSLPRPDLGLSEKLASRGLAASAVEGRRVNARPLTEGFSSIRATALAIDAADFDKVGWYRPDFAREQSLTELMRAITPGEPLASSNSGGDGLPLPADATGLSLWAHPDRPQSRLILAARLRDDGGRYFDVELGVLDQRGWQKLEAPLVNSGVPTRPGYSNRSSARARLAPANAGVLSDNYDGKGILEPPFTLLALHVSGRRGTGGAGAIFLDSLSAVSPGGEHPVESFRRPLGNSMGEWQPVRDLVRPGLQSLDLSRSVARDGSEASTRFSWSPGGTGLLGIRYGDPEEPLPAVVSREMLEAAEVELGDSLSIGASTFAIPIRVAAVADFFPTLDPREAPFVVTDLAGFVQYANRHNQRVVSGPNELWVEFGPEGTGEGGAAPLDRDGTTAEIYQLLEEEGLRVQEARQSWTLVEERAGRPLTNASWGGLLVLMFLALVLASASGVVLFSYMDTRERQTEFALLRTIGSSRSQVNGVVWFSLFLVVVCGIGLGTWAGQLIGASILPILEVGEGGSRVTPPMTLETNWVTLAGAYVVLAAVTAATVLWLAWLTSRMEVHQVLRAGEAAR